MKSYLQFSFNYASEMFLSLQVLTQKIVYNDWSKNFFWHTKCKVSVHLISKTFEIHFTPYSKLLKDRKLKGKFVNFRNFSTPIFKHIYHSLYLHHLNNKKIISCTYLMNLFPKQPKLETLSVIFKAEPIEQNGY